MERKQTIYLYTDGAASGNPGPGGWGAVLICGSLRKELSGAFALTTNNRMELYAVRPSNGRRPTWRCGAIPPT